MSRESPEFKHFDLCYSFKALVCREYGRLKQLHDATWNYRNNWCSAFGKQQEDTWISYKKALWNLIVFMFGHYINAFKLSGAWKGHQAILALECFTIADQLGRYHCWYQRADLTKPGILQTRWMDLPSDPQDDSQSSYTSALAMLGSPKLQSFGHLKVLSWYFDHVYHQSRNIGHLTWKARVYDCKLNEVISHLLGMGELDFSPWYRLFPHISLKPGNYPA